MLRSAWSFPLLCLSCVGIWATSSSTSWAQTSYPMLLSVKPAAAQVGTTTECEVSSRYSMHGAHQVLITGDGVTGEVVPPMVSADDKAPNITRLKVKFHVAPTATPGVRDFRIITPRGPSTVGQLVIARDPVILESANNNTLEKAQAISLPATVCGTIETNEDLDYFKFPVTAGTFLTFHVRAQRLENRIHDLQTQVDPIITLRNASGTTIAQSDNYYAADPLLHYKFEHTGDYYLELRDVRYKGNADWVYSIEVINQPYTAALFPLSVAPGVESKLQPIGFGFPAGSLVSVQVPSEAPQGVRTVAPLLGNKPLNATQVVVTSLPTLVEAANDNNTPETAQPVTLPAAINGRIESAADVDYFAFEAKAGQTFAFELFGRRIQSLLDSNLRVLSGDGKKQLAEVDDMRLLRVDSPDSILESWSAPADGKYLLEVRDLHLRGGDNYPYVVLISPVAPYFLLEADTDKTALAPGLNGAIYVRCLRKSGFTGEIQLAVDGLPPGITATPGRILAEGTDGCIILQAAADAPVSAANIVIRGNAQFTQKDGSVLNLTATAHPLQETYMPGGGRGHYPVEMHTVAVNAPMDLRSVKISTNAVTLKPGESQKIEVTLERAPGMKQNVTLDVALKHLEAAYGNSLPKGVTIDGTKSKTLLTGDDTKGFITLKAAPDAPAVDKQIVPVLAHVSINFVMKISFASEPLLITVGPGAATEKPAEATPAKKKK